MQSWTQAYIGYACIGYVHTGYAHIVQYKIHDAWYISPIKLRIDSLLLLAISPNSPYKILFLNRDHSNFTSAKQAYPNLPNRIRPTKPNLPHQTHNTHPDKPNIPVNQIPSIQTQPNPIHTKPKFTPNSTKPYPIIPNYIHTKPHPANPQSLNQNTKQAPPNHIPPNQTHLTPNQTLQSHSHYNEILN